MLGDFKFWYDRGESVTSGEIIAFNRIGKGRKSIEIKT